MKDLTKAEEQVMMYLWERREAFVKDLLEDFSEPKPAYNTVSTIVRILESKGFVAYRSQGKAHLYYPLVSKEAYMKHAAGGLLKTYFNGSLSGFVSFFS
ncbi:MAG: BlaI/MecI/CopY family transcriptional regulator, partial [Bacteroidota bacterium]|nr:BlaI/MecI/CopY family transcriptional regulator [Bacteroidota bacterium]MDX5430849.1 BlaI/MecI/CopY family transcriptional regulator [Bacteroidota bacterium]MDX5469593.1 BlaI/MecI/CopY family transcriptional regulator [Bacteroidota bacterium]